MSDCPVCAREALRNGSRATSVSFERETRRRLRADFLQAMEGEREPDGHLRDWAVLRFLDRFRARLYMRGYQAGYQAGLRKDVAVKVPRTTTGAA